MFLWNRLDQSDVNQLNSKIKDLKKNLENSEKTNKNLMCLFDHLIDSTDNQENIINYNPLMN